MPITSDDFSNTFDAAEAGRYSVEVVREEPSGNRIEVYSSPVWFESGSPFDLGKLKRNKKKGTAKLEVTGLRTAGELKLSGKGLKTQRKSAGPGSAKLKLKPKGKLAKNLKRKGKAKVKAKVVFTPERRRRGAAERQGQAEAQAEAPMTDLDRAVHRGDPRLPRGQGGRGVLVVANPATIGLGERFRAEAGRADADGVLALMAERAHARRPSRRRRRRGDGGRRRRPLPDRAVALAHRGAPGRDRGRGADRDPARGHRGDARPGDERRHGGPAPQGRGDRRAARPPARRPGSPARAARTCGSGSATARGSPTPAT